MRETPNLLLKLPDSTDYVNIEDINGNMEIIDAEIATITNPTTGVEAKLNKHLNEDTASTTKKGHVRVDGDTILIDGNGVIRAPRVTSRVGEFLFFPKGSVQTIASGTATQIAFTGNPTGYTTSTWATKDANGRITISEPGVYRITVVANLDGGVNSGKRAILTPHLSDFSTRYDVSDRVPSISVFRLTESTMLSITVSHDIGSSTTLAWSSSGCLIERLV